MNARLLLLTVPLLVASLAGCLGGDAKGGDEQVLPAQKEIAKGLPPKTFNFEGSPMTPSGSAEKMEECQTAHPPWGLIYPCTDKTKFKWNVTGLTPLGTGEEGTSVGEVFYMVWLGKAGEGGAMDWIESGTGPQVAKSGSIAGETAWGNQYNDITSVLVTLETVNDGQVEIQFLRANDMAEPAKYDLANTGALTSAGGAAKVVYSKDNTQVDITITAFGLPNPMTGHYEAFLRNAEGDRSLGTVNADGSELKIPLTATHFAFNWQIFVNLEGPDTEKPGPGGLRVLTSRFAN